ncbi:MAG TPA: plastocyanin/azurin family copper-binding protein [Gemmatimonadales bacterium]|jgi:plastocyanin
MRLNFVSGLAVLLAGCGGLNLTASNGNNGGGNTGPTAAITVQDYSYAPSVITIKAGTKVNWTNNGPSSHSVTSDTTGQFDSGALDAPMGNGYGGMTSGGLFQVTFSTPGTYTYHCMFHAQMHATITVQ